MTYSSIGTGYPLTLTGLSLPLRYSFSGFDYLTFEKRNGRSDFNYLGYRYGEHQGDIFIGSDIYFHDADEQSTPQKDEMIMINYQTLKSMINKMEHLEKKLENLEENMEEINEKMEHIWYSPYGPGGQEAIFNLQKNAKINDGTI